MRVPGVFYSSKTLVEILKDGVDFNDPMVQRDFKTGRGYTHINWRKYYDDPQEPQIAPLAGHAGHCDKVTSGTVTGKIDVPCSCGAKQSHRQT